MPDVGSVSNSPETSRGQAEIQLVGPLKNRNTVEMTNAGLSKTDIDRLRAKASEAETQLMTRNDRFLPLLRVGR